MITDNSSNDATMEPNIADPMERYMARALQLAALGRGFASPNPMVGAVVVAPDGRIIGEGYHRRCGGPHAEVNAINSVAPADSHLLTESDVYVTLEPCAHYGKTPPCAELLTRTGVKRVIVGTVDPFAKVAGKGIAMLREAGIEVVVGVLEKECREINRKFFIAHTLKRPFVTLKWAQSADGFMDCRRTPEHPHSYRFSNPMSTLSTMKLRAEHDAILTTSATILADHPTFSLRNWDGCAPMIAAIDRKALLTPDHTPAFSPLLLREGSLADMLHTLYAEHNCTSLLTEAGPTLLQALINEGLWDSARVETSPVALGEEGCFPAPKLSNATSVATCTIGNNTLAFFDKKQP